MTSTQFTWIPVYNELAHKLVDWEARQPELTDLLERLREKGLVITPLMDRDESGNQFLLQEIDPFTFMGSFNRGIKLEQRIGILARTKEIL